MSEHHSNLGWFKNRLNPCTPCAPSDYSGSWIVIATLTLTGDLLRLAPLVAALAGPAPPSPPSPPPSLSPPPPPPSLSPPPASVCVESLGLYQSCDRTSNCCSAGYMCFRKDQSCSLCLPASTGCPAGWDCSSTPATESPPPSPAPPLKSTIESPPPSPAPPPKSTTESPPPSSSPVAAGEVPRWGTCGGTRSCLNSDDACFYQSKYYSQCLPAADGCPQDPAWECVDTTNVATSTPAAPEEVRLLPPLHTPFPCNYLSAHIHSNQSLQYLPSISPQHLT